MPSPIQIRPLLLDIETTSWLLRDEFSTTNLILTDVFDSLSSSWLHAGTWATAAGVVANTPVEGVGLNTNPGFEGVYVGGLAPGYSFVGGTGVPSEETVDAYGGSGSSQKITVPSEVANNTLNSPVYPLLQHRWYGLNYKLKTAAGSVGLIRVVQQFGAYSIIFTKTGSSSAAWGSFSHSFRAPATGNHLTDFQQGWSAPATYLLDNFYIKPLHLSTLISVQQRSLSTLLAEQIISAYSLGSQCGIVQSDRSFASKAAVASTPGDNIIIDASQDDLLISAGGSNLLITGQTVVALKEITGVGGAGLTTNDTITTGGFTYSIASVAGGSNVAYDDTAKTQTVTLVKGLNTDLSVDDKVGLDWASWNGVICYFDGTGKIKTEEIVAGVYTDRSGGGVTTAFVAGKSLSLRHEGTSYSVGFNGAAVGTTITTVAAAAQVGTYWGMFSTLAANTITSMSFWNNINGTAAEPGPGVRTVTDTTGAQVYLSGGKAILTGRNAIDGILSEGQFTRTTGRVFIIKGNAVGAVNAQLTLHMGTTATLTSSMASIMQHGSLITSYGTGFGTELSLAAATIGAEYKLIMPFGASGAFYIVKGGTEFSNNILLYKQLAYFSAGNPYMLSMVYYNTMVANIDFIRSPQTLWLPTPLLSDGFGSTFGTSDGFGHAEGEQASTQEKITNGTFNSDLSGWTLAADVSGGTITWDAGTAKITQGAVQKAMYLIQTLSTVPGVQYTYSATCTFTDGGNVNRIVAGTSIIATDLGASLFGGATTYSITFTATTYITWIALHNAGPATKISNWDNATCKVTTPTTVLGAGGSGGIWTTAGTWATGAGVVANTPVEGAETVTNGNMEAGDPPTGWNVVNSSVLDSAADERTGGSGSASISVVNGAPGYGSARQIYNLTLWNWYSVSIWAKKVTGGYRVTRFNLFDTGNRTDTDWYNYKTTGLCSGNALPNVDLGNTSGTAGHEARFDDISIKPLPISTLITNQVLSTTDVLCEQVISAYTLLSQVGIVQSDRSFAAKAAATASAGQAVLPLKEVTGILGSVYPPAQSDTYVKATSKVNTSFWPYMATNPLLSVLGAGPNNSWVSVDTNPQRFHIDLGSPIIVTKIYYENYHNTALDTNVGAKNFTLWGSNTAGDFADLTYANDGTWIQIGGSYQFNEHVAANTADPKFITVANSTAYRYYALKIADNWGDDLYIGFRRIELQQTGLTTSDTITVGGATYSITSVTGGSNVAYNDTAKTQTITLGSNLAGDVAADAAVGVNWASWNGSLHYFDGAGNIKVDEILAGVYTNRGSTGSTPATFSAGARFIVRKIGSEYRIFYKEALIGSAISTIVAGARVGTYWGMFSTLAANTISSFVVYDTGNVISVYGNLDKYSKD